MFFYADPHFRHSNIIKYVGRPFNNVDEMDRTLVRKYREKVKDSDEVFFLGDFCLGGVKYKDSLERLLDKLPGQKHLILGNHDRMGAFDYTDIGFLSVHTALEIYMNKIPTLLVHDPAITVIAPEKLSLCGHVHNLFKHVKNTINVGVDVWDYYPVSDVDILEYMINNHITIKE